MCIQCVYSVCSACAVHSTCTTCSACAAGVGRGPLLGCGRAAGRARARCRGRTRAAAYGSASCAAGRTRRAASRWTQRAGRRGDGGRAAAHRPPPAAAVRWRPMGCQRGAHDRHSLLVCQYAPWLYSPWLYLLGCTVPGVASQRPPASMLLSSGRMSSGRSAKSVSACRSSDECAIGNGGFVGLGDRRRGAQRELCQHDARATNFRVHVAWRYRQLVSLGQAHACRARAAIMSEA